MSDWSPPPRPGYTRSGKSLKAVRRYYALKDQERAKHKRSPNREDRDRDREQDREQDENRTLSTSKRKRSPDDDKLSKRIAAELKVQAEANEKRTLRQAGMPVAPTERSDLPIIIQPREAGPTFVTAPNENEATPAIKSAVKSVKSGKSGKSVVTLPQLVADMSPTSKGCLLTNLVFALVYLTTYVLMLIIDNFLRAKEFRHKSTKYSSFVSIRWLAIASFLVLVAVPYWFLAKHKVVHAISSMIIIVLSAVNLIVNIVYTILLHLPLFELQESVNIYKKDPLDFWLPIVYLVVHITAIGLMIRQLVILMSGQLIDKSRGKVVEEAHMSMYLSPG